MEEAIMRTFLIFSFVSIRRYGQLCSTALHIFSPITLAFQNFFYKILEYTLSNTNVSNARMNIPNAIKSLKSKCLLSIHITPILCKNRGQPPCNTVVLLNHIIINIYLQCKKVRNIFNIIAYFFYS